MKLINLMPAFSDDRGDIIDILSNEEISALTFITFKKGAVRANHFHKETIQWNYLISGEILLVTKMPGERKQETLLKKGDLAETPEGESHALKAVTDAELLVITRGPRSGSNYELDTFRVEPPLIT